MAIAEAEKLNVRRRWTLPWIDEAALRQGREYAGTFVTEFAVLASQILAYKLAAYYMGKEGFAEYAVARRTISLIYPVPLLGLGVALPRYIAYASGQGDSTRSGRYFGATLWWVGCTTALCALLMNLFSGGFAYLFFGSTEYAHLVFPLSVMLIGLALHAVVYAYFRGHLVMKRANLLQLVNLGFVPLVAFFAFTESVRSVLLALGVLWTAGAGAALLFTPWQQMSAHTLAEARELLRYGVPRVPGDFIQMALLTLPATFVAHLRGVQEAGFVAFGISVLAMIGSMFAPIGLILLPKASRLLTEGALAELRDHVLRIVKVTVIVSGATAVAIEIFAEPLIRLYLGPGFGELAAVVRIVILGALPFAIYCALRGLIDAYHSRAVNTLNNGIAFVTFLLCSGALLAIDGSTAIAVALLTGLFTLGGLTVREARKIIAR